MYKRGATCGHRIPAYPTGERRMQADDLPRCSKTIHGSESHLSSTPLGRRQSPMRGCRQGRPMTSLFVSRTCSFGGWNTEECRLTWGAPLRPRFVWQGRHAGSSTSPGTPALHEAHEASTASSSTISPDARLCPDAPPHPTWMWPKGSAKGGYRRAAASQPIPRA